jgi:glycopeptide antibiotics resistance protein
MIGSSVLGLRAINLFLSIRDINDLISTGLGIAIGFVSLGFFAGGSRCRSIGNL